MKRWFYTRDQQKLGPLSSEELKQLADCGGLKPSDMVLQEGSEKWLPANSVKGLFRKPGQPLSDARSATIHDELPLAVSGSRTMERLGWSALLVAIASAAAWFAMESMQLKVRLANNDQAVGREPAGGGSELARANQKFQEQQKAAQSLTKRVTELEESSRKDGARIQVLEKQLADAKNSERMQAGDAGRLEARLRLLTPTKGQPYYEPIDHYALQAPPEAEQSIDALAKYLVAPAENDREKVRAIFRWVTDRLTYDLESLHAKRLAEYRPDAVLKLRKCVCLGTARMMEALGRSAGLDIVLVTGYARGYTDFYALNPKEGEGHAWNAVKVDGKWQLLDATWAAGAVSGRQWVKRFNDVFFLIPPEEIIHTHFPGDSKWQLLDAPIKREEFDKLNRVRPIYLAKQEESRKMLRAEKYRDFVLYYAHPDTTLIVLDAPPRRQLLAGTKYLFRFETAEYTDIAVGVRGKKWDHLKRNGQVFEGEATPERGELCVFGKLETKGDLYWRLLEYVVE
jgi:hypothetical protein